MNELIRYFEAGAMPKQLHSQFLNLARSMMSLPRNAESTTAMRKLLEAMDCTERERCSTRSR